MKNYKVFCVFVLFCFIFTDKTLGQLGSVQRKDLWAKVRVINPISITTKQPIKNYKNTVFVFLSPECPLCRNYIPELNRIKKTYTQYELVGVFPGKSYSVKEVKAFVRDYKLTFAVVMDEKKLLTHLLKASVTPEVVLLDKKGGVAYSGLIDDKIIELGQQRQIVSKHFLTDAMEALEINKKAAVNNTKPIGCYINDI
ncbi:redoxin domain-containing protein [Pedobacter kyungheensis]|uniref:redoxin domain-containing protein n=1 Tax=Pedobacter kyungheensis TaxID=1069985 RepID=UPI00068C4C5B|nr:redoxin domain-containing protein [Pedobacter kyungheensis]